jgi:chromosome partitioning protein
MMNILMVATHIVIPVTPGIYEIIGLNSLLDTIEPVIDELNPNLQIVGILPTRVKQTRFAKDGVAALRKRFGEKMVFPIIGDRVVIERAHMQGQDVYSYEPASDGAQMYLAATRQLLSQIGLAED